MIGMRLTFLADGGQSELGEAVRMASEKATAALEVQQAAAIAALTGKAAQIPARTLPIYRRKTRSVRWAAHESGGLKSLRRSDEGRCIQRRG